MTTNTEENKELIVINNDFKPIEVFSAAKGLDPIIEQIRQKVKSEIFDVTTEAGRKRMGSVARQIGSSKCKLEKMAKELTEDWRTETISAT